MTKLHGWFLCFLIFIPLAHASKHFIISPYTLKADNGDIHLKFETEKKETLSVSILKEGLPETKISIEAIPGKLMTINLGKQRCDLNLGYSVVSQNAEKLVTTNLPGFECHLYDEFTFGFLSDTQSSAKNHAKVASVVSKELELSKINFILHTGDITHVGGVKKRWLNFFEVADTYLAGRPIIAAIGNHSYWKDKKHRPLPELFKKYMRWEGSKEIGYMSIIYPLFQMVVVNSTFEKLTPEETQKQYNWIEETLKEAQLENRPVIFSMHYPPFSSSLFTHSKEAKYLRKQYVPLFEKYGVKLVLTGHTHVYERGFKAGVHYVIAGPAGGSRDLPTASNPYKVVRKPLARTFTTVKVTKDQISIKTINHKNKEIDKASFEL